MKHASANRRFKALGTALISCCFLSCKTAPKEASPQAAASSSASPPAQGLSADDAAQVLARVGTQPITLGDFAAGLERMDRYERLRYESPDRRKALLDELIDLELLAQEARSQKLDQAPEFQIRLGRALRDEVLRDLRAQQPPPEAIALSEVRAYFESHRTEYREPERRRASAIVVNSEAKAKALLEQAKTADPVQFGQLVRLNSVRKTADDGAPPELAGDLGIVSFPSDSNSKEPRLPSSVQKAIFTIAKVGEVYPQPVRDGNDFYILRMTGRTEARERTFAEAERSIRIRLVDERIEQAEKRLVEQLKAKASITVDDLALGKLRLRDPKRQQEKLGNAIDH